MSQLYKKLSELCKSAGITGYRMCKDCGLSTSTMTDLKSGRKKTLNAESINRIATYFGVSVGYLLGEEEKLTQPEPELTDNYVTFPVLGDVAAGYDHVAYEDWSGDTMDIPASWLRGRKKEDYFVLRVSGDSMFPTYQNGDLVLVLRQATMDRSGQIGVVVYDDDKATLKRVEYVMGEDWMVLSPVNPRYPPIKIVDENLEHCRVLGIPKMLVRNISD